jgi:hypothetical protein
MANVIRFGERDLRVAAAYASDFESLDDFWFEGTPDVTVEAGSLVVRTTLTRDDRYRFISSVFCGKPFQGNLLVEFDARSIHPDSHRNFNLFLHTRLRDGRDLYGTRGERRGDYPEYHAMDNYLFTFLPGNVAGEDPPREYSRWRFRRNPGFRLMKEIHSTPIEQQRWYHFQYLVRDGVVACSVDRNPLETYGWRDPDPLSGGHLGFRTFCSHMAYRTLRVWRVEGPSGAADGAECAREAT